VTRCRGPDNGCFQFAQPKWSGGVRWAYAHTITPGHCPTSSTKHIWIQGIWLAMGSGLAPWLWGHSSPSLCPIGSWSLEASARCLGLDSWTLELPLMEPLTVRFSAFFPQFLRNFCGKDISRKRGAGVPCPLYPLQAMPKWAKLVFQTLGMAIR